MRPIVSMARLIGVTYSITGRPHLIRERSRRRVAIFWKDGLSKEGCLRRPPAFNQQRHLDFEGCDPTAVLFRSAELAAVVPECPCGISLVFVRVLIARKPTSIVYFGLYRESFDVMRLPLRTLLAFKSLCREVNFRSQFLINAFVL